MIPVEFSSVLIRIFNSFRFVHDNSRLRPTTLLIMIVFVMVTSRMCVCAGSPMQLDVVDEYHGPSNEPSIDAEDILRQAKQCELRHASHVRNQSELYCNATFDQFLCWGFARAGTSVTQNCPPGLPFIDSSSYKKIVFAFFNESEDARDKAERHCGLDGKWLDRNNKSSVIGWTDFIKCFPPYMQDLLENASASSDGFTSKVAIATWVRGVEIFGLSASALSLIIAITIFNMYPQLLNHRTRIHRHLSSGLLAQCITTLIIYVDQETFAVIEKYNKLCVIFYASYELLTSIGFAFMLIEGLTLYRIVSVKALRPQSCYGMLVIAAYLFPTINVIIWFTVASNKYGWANSNGCWFGYNLDRIYWILQTPRLVVLSTNVIFLLIVLKMLLQKLYQRRTTELKRIRTAVRATVFLLPLFGITNFLSLTNAPLTDTTLSFAIWAFFAYFLRSFQGFFVSYIYCFRNNEVLEVLRRQRTSKLRKNKSVQRVPITECEVVRRDEEMSRAESLKRQDSPLGCDSSKPPNDAAMGNELENIEMDIIVHKLEEPCASHNAEEN